MYRRCADRLWPIGYGQRKSLVNGRRPRWLLVAMALGLTGCGSSPSQLESPPTPVETAPAEATPPAAQTFPLEGEGAQPAEIATPSAPTPPPPPSSPTQEARAQSAPSTPASASATPEPSLPPEAVQQFDDAVAMVSSGNFAAAEQAFRALSTAYPAYSGALVNLGILQAKAGKLADAEATFKQALERNPDNAAAYNQLGIVYRRQGRFTDAEQAYTRAVTIDPNYANAHLNLGVLCDLYLQQPQRALEAFERYLSLSTAPDEKVTAWVKELKVRLESAQRASGAG